MVDSATKLNPKDSVTIWVLLASTFTVMLNETIMGVALPTLMKDLNIEPVIGQWLSTAFLLTMSVIIPATGILIQRYGVRKLFIFAMGFFLAGTVTCALSNTFVILVFGRIVQGAGTAVMTPLLMTTTISIVPPQIRGRIMARISIVMSVAPAIGPTISGLLLHYLNWHWMFIIMIPIALTALAVGVRNLQPEERLEAKHIDIASFILSGFGFGGVVYGLSLFGQDSQGAETISPLIPLGVGLLTLSLFILRQIRLAKEEKALLDLRVFLHGSFRVGSLVIVFTMVSLFGMVIVLPLYASGVLHLEALNIGLLLLPGGILMGVCSPFVGRIVDRFGPRTVLIPGTFLTACGITLLGTVNEHTATWQLIAMHLVLSLGMSCTFSPAYSTALGSLPRQLTPYGSATVTTMQQLAAAGGTAVYITVLSIAQTLATQNGSAPSAAFVTGVQAAFHFGTVVAAATFLLSFFLRSPKPQALPTSQQ